MLELRPNCECCDRDLATDDANVFICTIECTWCGDCTRRLDFTCPNCGGALELAGKGLIRCPYCGAEIFI